MQALSSSQVVLHAGVAGSASAAQLPRQLASAQPPQRHRAVASFATGRRRGALQVVAAKKAGDKAAEKPKAKGFGPAKPVVGGTGEAKDGTRANSGVEAPGGGYWTDVKVSLEEMKDRPADKLGKAVILANNKNICLFMHKGKVFCTAGNGTAYEYPLFDSEIFDGPDGTPTIRCKFDRTSYNLETGAVIEWCPKDDSPVSVRNMLATLKNARRFRRRRHPAPIRLKQVTTPVNLKVFPTRVQKDGAIEILYSM